MYSKLRVSLSPVLVIFAFTFFLPSNALSLSFTVDWTDDAVDINPGDGICDINPNPLITKCSLRAAIQEANAIPDTHDVIQLPPGTYTLSISGTDDTAVAGDLDITDDITIESTYPGPLYADTTIVDGGGIDRVFDLHGTVSNDVVVRFNNFTIQNGEAKGGTGGGGGILANYTDLSLDGMIIRSNEVLGASSSTDTGGGLKVFYDASVPTHINRTTFSENAAYIGGAIHYASVNSKMIMSDSTLDNNFAQLSGGGIFNGGPITVSNSTISGNGAGVAGGGISIYSKLVLTNVTISGNRSTGTIGAYYGSSGIASALYLAYTAPTDFDAPLIRNTTIAENKGSTTISFSTNTRSQFLNTIISSVGQNCDFNSGAYFSGEAYNLSSDNTCKFVDASDLINTDPMLTPLADNGGKTLTHLPQLGSPVIDAGFNLLIPDLSTDQRGISRPQGNTFDIGSVEVNQCSYYPIMNKFGKLSYICL